MIINNCIQDLIIIEGKGNLLFWKIIYIVKHLHINV